MGLGSSTEASHFLINLLFSPGLKISCFPSVSFPIVSLLLSIASHPLDGLPLLHLIRLIDGCGLYYTPITQIEQAQTHTKLPRTKATNLAIPHEKRESRDSFLPRFVLPADRGAAQTGDPCGTGIRRTTTHTPSPQDKTKRVAELDETEQTSHLSQARVVSSLSFD